MSVDMHFSSWSLYLSLLAMLSWKRNNFLIFTLVCLLYCLVGEPASLPEFVCCAVLETSHPLYLSRLLCCPGD